MGSSSPELYLSYRVLRSVPARYLSVPSTFLGVSSPSRRQPVESTLASIPSSLCSVLDVSHVLDGLLLRWSCRFISPRSHVRDSSFRGFPSVAAVPSRRWPLPSCRLTASPADDLRHQRQKCGPAFRALLCSGVRSATQGVSPRTVRSPPGFYLPQVLRLLAVSLPSQQLRS
jgi:hypothetical protein